jgi:hypothetical protein
MRIARLVVIITILVLCLASGAPWAQNTAKHEDIKKLLDIIGARGIGLRVFNQVIAAFQRSNTEAPEEIWQEISREAETRIDDFITGRLAPIYDQYLSHDDIKGMLAFYQSPLGEKLLSIMPQMSQESMIAGQAWGREFAEAVKKRLEDKRAK